MMNPKLVAIYKQARAIHEAYVQADGELRRFLSTCPNTEDQADAAYALREIADMVDEVRKMANSTGELAQRFACIIAGATGNPEPIRTEYCTATPDVKPIASVPRQSSDPEGYALLMEHLGIPRAMWDRGDDKSVVKPNWPGMMSYLAEQMKQGKPLPPGIDPDKTYSEYRLLIRKKKGVGE